MPKIDKLGSARRFGSRYGTRPKHQFAKIEKEQRRKHTCPYCLKEQAKRLAAGIWQCRSCNAKFTGRAYTLSRVESEKPQAVQVEENILLEKPKEEEYVEEAEEGTEQEQTESQEDAAPEESAESEKEPTKEGA